ncbi:MAG: hypothetical protein B7Z35_12455 [Hydrogenophilales bacterium 12-61-10]|nr:MAG: hypothetical protein B7Z35_12455 [Hydrogenophilales bacterium 12-61-10]
MFWLASENSLAAAPDCPDWFESAVAVWVASPSLSNFVALLVGLAQAWTDTPRAIAMAVDKSVLFIMPLLENVLDDEKTDCQEWTQATHVSHLQLSCQIYKSLKVNGIY